MTREVGFNTASDQIEADPTPEEAERLLKRAFTKFFVVLGILSAVFLAAMTFLVGAYGTPDGRPAFGLTYDDAYKYLVAAAVLFVVLGMAVYFLIVFPLLRKVHNARR